MKYAIQNTNGQWWTGDCWGAEQAREEYGDDCSTAALPTWIAANNGDTGERAELIMDGEPSDYVYSDPDEEPGNDIVAGVREV